MFSLSVGSGQNMPDILLLASDTVGNYDVYTFFFHVLSVLLCHAVIELKLFF